MRDSRLEIVFAHAGLVGRRLFAALAARHACTPTVSLAQTLARLEQRSAELLFLDLDLPDASGAPALARVRRSFPRLPIVALATRAAEQIRPAGPLAGAHDYWSWSDIDSWSSEMLSGRLRQIIAPPGAGAPGETLACRLLLAEHLAERRGLLSHMLKSAGARVDQAADGFAALGKTLAAEDRGAPYSAVLINAALPGLGDSAAEALREAGYRRPIVGLEEVTAKGAPRRTASRAIDEWLTSPFDRLSLLEALRRWSTTPALRPLTEPPQ